MKFLLLLFLALTAVVSARVPRAATIVEAVTVDEQDDGQDNSVSTVTGVTDATGSNQVDQTDNNQVRQLPVQQVPLPVVPVVAPRVTFVPHPVPQPHPIVPAVVSPQIIDTRIFQAGIGGEFITPIGGVSAGGQIGGDNLLSLGFEANALGNRPVIPGHQHYNGQYAYYSPYASSMPNHHSYYRPTTTTTTYLPAYSARTVATNAVPYPFPIEASPAVSPRQVVFAAPPQPRHVVYHPVHQHPVYY